MRLSTSIISGSFPSSNLTDTLYSTPSSNVLQSFSGYGSYDYCSMPHPHSAHYAEVNEAELIYVEYLQRHQRRTPYNLLEGDVYDCSDVNLVTGTNLINNPGAIEIIVDNSTIGSCQFPELTSQGIQDAFNHGHDLWQVYGTLGLLPSLPDKTVGFRVSNSKLTESTAQNVIAGMWPQYGRVLIHQMPNSVDTINSGFKCPGRDSVKKAQLNSPEWQEHLQNFNATLENLNSTGITKGFAADSAWTVSLDHLCDNFQSKVCNGYPLDIDSSIVDKVFAGGDWEWDFNFRASSNATKRQVLTEGLFLNEIIGRLENPGHLKYWHTFAHDGDIGPVAGALGIEYLRWPGMASNIALEVWKQIDGQKVVRVLYCGAPIRSTWIQEEHPLDDFVKKLGQFVLDKSEC